MEKLSLKTAIVFLLIATFLFSPITTNRIAIAQDKVNSAFIGIKYKNVPQKMRDVISWRMTALLESQKQFNLTKSDGVQILYGKDTILDLLDKQDNEAFLVFARQHNYKHVYSGFLENQSQDTSQVFLVGKLNRYDPESGAVNIYNVKNSFDKFGNDLVKFKKDYVDALFLEENKSPWMVVALISVFIVAMVAASSLGAFGGQEDKEPPITDE